MIMMNGEDGGGGARLQGRGDEEKQCLIRQ